MRSIFDGKIKYLFNGLADAIVLLLVSCSLIAGSDETATLVMLPFEGAPLTAAIDGKIVPFH